MFESNNDITVSFSYTDEFGQLSECKKSFDEDAAPDGVTIPFLVEQFKLFLLGSGFSPEIVDKIEYNED